MIIYILGGLVGVSIFLMIWVVRQNNKVWGVVRCDRYYKDFSEINRKLDLLQRGTVCLGHKLTFVRKHELDLTESAGTIKTTYQFECILCDARIDKTATMLTEAEVATLKSLGLAD